MTTRSSILAWRIPCNRGAWQAAVHGIAKSWATIKQLSHFHVWVSLDGYDCVFRVQ